jgi:hypothetical protein
MVKAVVVSKFGELKEKNFQKLELETLYKKCGFSSDTDSSVEVTWSHENNWISLYAKVNGRHNHINKYDFPPPCDIPECMYYGSVLAFKHENEEPKNGEILDLTKEEWEKFYEKAFGGFESLNEEETSEDELEDVPEDLKTKDGYLKDGFVVDTSSGDEAYLPQQEEDSDNSIASEESFHSSCDESDLNSEDELSEESYLSDDD